MTSFHDFSFTKLPRLRNLRNLELFPQTPPVCFIVALGMRFFGDPSQSLSKGLLESEAGLSCQCPLETISLKNSYSHLRGSAPICLLCLFLSWLAYPACLGKQTCTRTTAVLPKLTPPLPSRLFPGKAQAELFGLRLIAQQLCQVWVQDCSIGNPGLCVS